MRHDVERYTMLLRTETNIRVRKLLTGMIQELEGRAPAPSEATATAPLTVPAMAERPRAGPPA